jgi:hypothetical protein
MHSPLSGLAINRIHGVYTKIKKGIGGDLRETLGLAFPGRASKTAKGEMSRSTVGADGEKIGQLWQ